MKLRIAAALALTTASSLGAQTPVTAGQNFQYAAPSPGTWTYAPAVDGSEAVFRDAMAQPQLYLHCTRASRQVTILKPATRAAPFISMWTTSQTRNLPASYDPATYRLRAAVLAFDPRLDAIAFSRGRLAVSVSGQPALVVASWEEVARVIEDCRT